MPQPPKTSAARTPNAQTIAVARLGAVTGRADAVSTWIDVHFNPASLQLQVSNELKDTKNNERKQYVAKATAKLTMELQFDTTDTGDDVTQTTKKLQAFVAPPLDQQNQSQVPPPVVMFEWGRIKFKGVAESYKETIDFFSANGVPLRALVNLTISRQDQVFDDAPDAAPANAGAMNNDLTDTSAPSAAAAANAGDAPDAARAVAAANGQENLRFGDGSALTVSASITLKPPAAFASAGFGVGLGAGAAIGIGGGAALGLSGGVAIGLSGTATIGAGGDATAGISGLSRLSASEGAFAGLRTTVGVRSSARLNTSRLQPPVASASLSTDRNASFRVGGKATVEGAAGLRADVGGSSAVRGKITFEGS
jgi:hypothetical protein